MPTSRNQAWIVVCASLSIGIAVYCLARANPPEIFTSIRATSDHLVAMSATFGSAPSFFYTLALGLLILMSAPSRGSVKLHFIAWTGLCLLLEVSQYPTISMWISGRLSNLIFESGLDLFGHYWLRGVFDPLDLLATFAGGLVAFVLAMQLPFAGSYANGEK